MADGRNDLPTRPDKNTKESDEFLKEWQQNERYEQSGDNAVVAVVKTRALKVIDALLNLTYTVRLQVSFTGRCTNYGWWFTPVVLASACRLQIVPSRSRVDTVRLSPYVLASR